MKKIIFFLILFVSIFICVGQQQQQYTQKRQTQWYPPYGTVPVTNITWGADPSSGWGISGRACAGCASYYYRITRTNQVYQDPLSGSFYYYFYFNFFSNSYYPNGNPSSTYLTGVNFLVDGTPMVFAQYILLEPGTDRFVAWIRSPNPNSSIEFNVAQMTVY